MVLKGILAINIISETVKGVGCKSVIEVADYNNVTDKTIRIWFKEDYQKFKAACLKCLSDKHIDEYKAAEIKLNKGIV